MGTSSMIYGVSELIGICFMHQKTIFMYFIDQTEADEIGLQSRPPTVYCSAYSITPENFHEGSRRVERPKMIMYYGACLVLTG